MVRRNTVDRICTEKESVRLAFLYTVLWGLVCHAYAFLNATFSHDSLAEFNGYAYSNAWKISLGRGIVPLYRELTRSALGLPWLIGAFTILWAGLTVVLIVRMFEVRSTLSIALISGVIIANLPVAANAATYLNDLDANMFGVMLSTLAAWLWRTHKHGFWLGSLLVAAALGIYQCLLSITLVLVIYMSFLSLWRHERFSDVFLQGLKAIVMVLAGCCIYLLSAKVICKLSGTPLATGKYNSLDVLRYLSLPEICRRSLGAYQNAWKHLLHPISSFPAGLISFCTGASVCLTLLAFSAQTLLNKTIAIKAKALCVLLLLLLPLCMNFSFVCMGNAHVLMTYAIWLFYLLTVLLMDRLQSPAEDIPFGRAICSVKAPIRYAAFLLIFVLLAGNVRTANALYLKKDIEKQANISYFTRVLYTLEHHEGYAHGETPVVFAGLPQQITTPTPAFEQYVQITGAWGSCSLTSATRKSYQDYFDYVLLNPTTLADDAVWNAMQQDERVRQMPSYPDSGCIQLLDGVLVVKLSD